MTAKELFKDYNISLERYGIKVWRKIPSESDPSKDYTVTMFILFRRSKGVPELENSYYLSKDFKCDCSAFVYYPESCKHITKFLEGLPSEEFN